LLAELHKKGEEDILDMEDDQPIIEED